jgi:hypothetical protein
VSRLKCKVVLVCLEMVLILTQDWCTICAKHTIGLEIVLDAPDGTPRCRGSIRSTFGLFGDSVTLTQERCTVYAKMYHRLGTRFGRT